MDAGNGGVASAEGGMGMGEDFRSYSSFGVDTRSLPPDIRGFGFPSLSLKVSSLSLIFPISFIVLTLSALHTTLQWTTKRGHYMSIKRSDLRGRGTGAQRKKSRSKRKRGDVALSSSSSSSSSSSAAAAAAESALPASAIILSTTKSYISFTTRRLMSLAAKNLEARTNVARLSYACVFELLAVISQRHRDAIHGLVDAVALTDLGEFLF